MESILEVVVTLLQIGAGALLAYGFVLASGVAGLLQSFRNRRGEGVTAARPANLRLAPNAA